MRKGFALVVFALFGLGIKIRLKVLNSDFWMGLTHFPVSVASWTDGSTVDYSNYLRPPMNATPQNRCTEIQYMANEWRDAGCTKKNHFICAMPIMKSSKCMHNVVSM